MEYFIKLLDEEVLMNEDRHRDGFKRQTETLSILHARCFIKATEFPCITLVSGTAHSHPWAPSFQFLVGEKECESSTWAGRVLLPFNPICLSFVDRK